MSKHLQMIVVTNYLSYAKDEATMISQQHLFPIFLVGHAYVLNSYLCPLCICIKKKKKKKIDLNLTQVITTTLNQSSI